MSERGAALIDGQGAERVANLVGQAGRERADVGEAVQAVGLVVEGHEVAENAGEDHDDGQEQKEQEADDDPGGARDRLRRRLERALHPLWTQMIENLEDALFAPVRGELEGDRDRLLGDRVGEFDGTVLSDQQAALLAVAVDQVDRPRSA